MLKFFLYLTLFTIFLLGFTIAGQPLGASQANKNFFSIFSNAQVNQKDKGNANSANQNFNLASFFNNANSKKNLNTNMFNSQAFKTSKNANTKNSKLAKHQSGLNNVQQAHQKKYNKHNQNMNSVFNNVNLVNNVDNINSLKNARSRNSATKRGQHNNINIGAFAKHQDSMSLDNADYGMSGPAMSGAYGKGLGGMAGWGGTKDLSQQQSAQTHQFGNSLVGSDTSSFATASSNNAATQRLRQRKHHNAIGKTNKNQNANNNNLNYLNTNVNNRQQAFNNDFNAANSRASQRARASGRKQAGNKVNYASNKNATQKKNVQSANKASRNTNMNQAYAQRTANGKTVTNRSTAQKAF